MTAVMAMIASPPGLFSTTTGWPHLADSLSANTRAVMSTPEPGPSGMMNLTGRGGQLLCRRRGAGRYQRGESEQNEPGEPKQRTAHWRFPSDFY